jgi:hypothetical protein
MRQFTFAHENRETYGTSNIWNRQIVGNWNCMSRDKIFNHMKTQGRSIPWSRFLLEKPTVVKREFLGLWNVHSKKLKKIF